MLKFFRELFQKIWHGALSKKYNVKFLSRFLQKFLELLPKKTFRWSLQILKEMFAGSFQEISNEIGLRLLKKFQEFHYKIFHEVIGICFFHLLDRVLFRYFLWGFFQENRNSEFHQISSNFASAILREILLGIPSSIAIEIPLETSLEIFSRISLESFPWILSKIDLWNAFKIDY